MLYIQRKVGESISISGGNKLTVLKMMPREASLLFEGPAFPNQHNVLTVSAERPFFFNVERAVVVMKLMSVERGCVRFGIEAPKHIIIKSVDASQEDTQ